MSNPVSAYEVGTPWPHPLPPGEGMHAVIRPGADGLTADLLIKIASPTADELRALRRGPLRIGLLPSPPLVWIVVGSSGLTLDAPYGVGIERDPEAIITAAGLARAWPPTYRRLLTVPVVDAATGLVAALRAVSMSRAWWMALADALDASPRPLAMRDYAAAIHRDSARLTPPAMLDRAAIVERAGRV